MLVLSLLILAAAPVKAPAPLTNISAPFGHYGDVVEPAKAEGAPVDLPVKFAPEKCEVQVILLAHHVSGAMRSIEQITAWLKANALENKLFSRKDTLLETIALLGKSTLSAQRACTEFKTRNGYAVTMTDAPAEFCDAPPGRATGDFWLMAGKKPAAVINIAQGAPNACKPRISTALFDSKAKVRLLVNLDWGGETSFTVIGDRCQNIDFTFDSATQEFVPKRISCK